MQIQPTLTLMLSPRELLSWIILGAITGFIMKRILGGREGIITATILGIVGAALASFAVNYFTQASLSFFLSLIIAIIGAAIAVLIWRAITNIRYSGKSPIAAPSQSVIAKPLPSPYIAPSSYQSTSGVAAASLPIFVSHSHTDNAWCRVFVDALKRQDCDVWYDEQGLGGGVIWQKQIVQELQSRPLFVVVLSPDATASQWVDEEIQLAISSRRMIIPVHHRQTLIEGFLTNRQIVDVRGLDGAQAATIVADAARRLIAI